MIGESVLCLLVSQTKLPNQFNDLMISTLGIVDRVSALQGLVAALVIQIPSLDTCR